MFETIEQTILSVLQSIFDRFGWFGVFGLMVFENATGITPSEIVLGFAGWMLIERHGISPTYIPLAGGFMALGSTIGASITYWVARIGGRPVIDRFNKFFRIDQQYIDRVEKQVHVWGTGIVMFGRLLPGIRTLINIPAGMAGIPFPKFFIATFLGSYVWCTLLIAAGYMLGHEWRLISDIIQGKLPYLLAVVFIGVVLWIVYYHRSKISIINRVFTRNERLD